MTASPTTLLPRKPRRGVTRLGCRWLAIGLCLVGSGAPAQTAPERPRPSVAPVAPAGPAGPTEAEKRAEKKAAAQRAEEKRATDKRIAEAQAQTERERLAREKLELDKRIAEAQAQTEREHLAREKLELDKRMAEAQARAERERLAREKVEADQRRLETEKADLERKLRMTEQASPGPVPAAVLLKAPSPVARHPHAGEPLLARQTFVDSWGQFTSRESAPRMVVIAPTAGSGFLMGSPSHEFGRDIDEKQHRVAINYPFALSETEITYAQWDACVADGGCGNSRNNWGWGRGQYPVVHVNWHHARAYADWLNSRLRLARDSPYRYRLPSEAEWEYAARADSSGPFGFAQNRNIAPDLANYDTRVAYQGSPTRGWNQDTKPVGSYPANAFGPKDMHGNVWEWVADCYEADYDRTPRDGSAHREHDSACLLRVVRGGSWYFTGEDLRTANRFRAPPGYHDDRGGFRLARTLPPPG